jgi:flagellar biosynthesis/type III secretory pathway protein FliH
LARSPNRRKAAIAIYQQEYLTQEGAAMGLVHTLREEGRAVDVQQGLQQGLQHGLQQGMQQSEARWLEHLLTQRFGALDPAIQQKIKSADTESLDHWLDRVLAANTLDEVFKDDQ